MMRNSHVLTFALCLLVAACGGDDTPRPDAGDGPDAGGADASGELTVPSTYTFESRFIPGESSVSYSGQVLRQVLITELTRYIGGLTDAIDGGTFTPVAGQVEQALDFYYRFDASGGQAQLTMSTTPALLQSSYDAISSARDLWGKIAGNDSDSDVTQHKDWSTELVGWSEDGVQSPDGLVRYWFGLLEAQALARVRDEIPVDPDGKAITKVYVTPEGQDLQQLIQKFLLGAVAFSQAADDYLDHVTPGKGLTVSNAQSGEAPYSNLEHHWDEAFGYFGAARDYGDYTDEELAARGGRPEYASGYHDTDGDLAIDLRSEYNFSYAGNAAKRDRGSAAEAPTDFTKDIFDAFLRGRAIISAAGDELSPEELEELLAQRDIIVQTWEKVIAATALHYINDTLRDTIAIGTEGYDFYNHAKHWSEMKGFALSLQFSPFSPLTDAQFARMHELMGHAPVLPGAEAEAIEAYKTDLLEARGILRDAYDFHPANVGDDLGQGGW